MAKSNYITRSGWQVLDQELKYLWKDERPKVTQAVSEAAALGDRSENAEYIYGKRRLREIDRRVRFLSKRLEVLQIVDYHPTQEGKVFFGAWVELENEEGEIKQYRIVGCDEFDPAKQWI
ncbi:transcription elongation factor GreB, partial [Glaesserella parasuis]